jgi:hypothetical protein
MTFSAAVDAGAHERGRQVRARVLTRTDHTRSLGTAASLPHSMRRLVLPITVAALAVAGAAPDLAGAHASLTGRLLVKLPRPRGELGRPHDLGLGPGGRPAQWPRRPPDQPADRAPAPRDTLTALRQRLLRDPRVVRVERETRARPRLVPNDPALGTPEPSLASVPGRRARVVGPPQQLPGGLGPEQRRADERRGDRLGIDDSHPGPHRWTRQPGQELRSRAWECPCGRARPRDARRIAGAAARRTTASGWPARASDAPS